MNFKKIISMTLAVLLAFGCLFAMTGCKKTDDEMYKPEGQKVKDDSSLAVGYQLDAPKEGEEIAVIKTTEGDITLRLFPEAAPTAVKSFVTLAKEGKYNGTIFHRVIKDFMIQTGDYEKGDGTGGKATPDETFADEFTNRLFNIRGAVAMANSGPNTNGSQFFINTASPDSFTADAGSYEDTYNQYADLYEEYKEANGYGFYEMYPDVKTFVSDFMGGINFLSYLVPQEVWNLYKAHGGNIHLDGAFSQQGGHTVFAQVIDGMNVVDKIQNAETDENSKPKTDIKIKSIEITTYKAK